MLDRKVNEALTLSLLAPKHAQSIFELIDSNRKYLRPWFPWVDLAVWQEDTETFINQQHVLFCENKAVQFTIQINQKIVGLVGYHEIDSPNEIGSIGYWLGAEYNGHGYMTLAVKELLSAGFSHYALNRIEIQCAKENQKSRAIPERLGFVQEGILRGAEKINGTYLDLVVYGLLKSEAE